MSREETWERAPIADLPVALKRLRRARAAAGAVPLTAFDAEARERGAS